MCCATFGVGASSSSASSCAAISLFSVASLYWVKRACCLIAVVGAWNVRPTEGFVAAALTQVGTHDITGHGDFVHSAGEATSHHHEEHEQETCTIDVVLPFSVEELEDKESYGYGKWTASLRNSISVAHMAAALLAYEHWITGDATVVRELESETLKHCRRDGRVLKAVTGLRFLDSVLDAHNHGGGGHHHDSSHHTNHGERNDENFHEDRQQDIHPRTVDEDVEETDSQAIPEATSRTKTQADGHGGDDEGVNGHHHHDLPENQEGAEKDHHTGHTEDGEAHEHHNERSSSPDHATNGHHHGGSLGGSHGSGHHNSEYMAELRQLAQQSILHQETPCAIVGCADPNAIQAYGLLASLLNVPHVFLDATLPLLLASSAVIPYSVANTVPMETLADSLLEYLTSLTQPRGYIAVIVDESEYGSFMGGYFETLAQQHQDLTMRLEVVNKDGFEDSTELVLDRIQKYGFRTFIMAVQHHDILHHVAEVAAAKDMIGPDVLWMFVDETLPLQFITDVLTHQPPDSPLARLVQGAGVIQILDGFMYNKNHPFLKSWHAQNATFVEKVNSFVAPLVSLKMEEESHHQGGHEEQNAQNAHHEVHDAQHEGDELVHDNHDEEHNEGELHHDIHEENDYGSHNEEHGEDDKQDEGPDEIDDSHDKDTDSSPDNEERHTSTLAHLLPDDYFQTTEPFLHSTFVYDAIMAILMSYCHLTLPPNEDDHDHHAVSEFLGPLQGNHGLVKAEEVLSHRGDRIVPLLHETSFHGASGLVTFEDRSRRRDSMVLGIYNIQPRRWRKHKRHLDDHHDKKDHEDLHAHQEHRHQNDTRHEHHGLHREHHDTLHEHHDVDQEHHKEHEEKGEADDNDEHQGEVHHEEESAGFDAVLTFVKHGNKPWEPAATHHEPFLYFSGSSDEPFPLIEAVEENYLSPIVRWVGLLLMISSLLISAISMSWTLWRRRDSLVKSAQPEFIYILCLGSMTSALTILMLSIDESYGFSEEELSAACAAAPWFFHVGYIATYCAISSKLWRIHRLLQFRRQNVNFRHVLLPFAALLTAALVVLTLWTSLDTLQWSRTVVTEFPRETVGRCSSDSLAAFNACLVVLEIASTALAVRMAWITRDINERFSESKWIFNAVCAQLQAWLIGIPLVLVLERTSTNAYFMAYSLLIWVFSVTSVTLVVFPRIYQWYQRRRPRRRSSSTGNAGSECNNTQNNSMEQGRVHISGIITLKPDNRHPSEINNRSRISSSEEDDVAMPVITNPSPLRRSSLRSTGTMTNCSTAGSTNERRASLRNDVASSKDRKPEEKIPPPSSSSSSSSSSTFSPSQEATGDLRVPSRSVGESTLVCRKNNKSQQRKNGAANDSAV